MRKLIEIALSTLVVACIPLGAATMPPITVTNQSDSLIQLVPIDDAHKAPAPLDQISSTLPPGAFILTNQTATPINVVVVLWSYTDRNGNIQERRFNCDGYIVVPPSTIVRANDSALISPGGCTMREYFAHLASGKVMVGGDLRASRNKAISDMADSLASVKVTVDCVIFADGRIWGPDSRQYYKAVSATYWAIQSVVEEVSAAMAAGQDMHVPLEKIRAETAGKGDQLSRLKNMYASTIHNSPSPEGTLKHYSGQSPLPEFRHIGEQTK